MFLKKLMFLISHLFLYLKRPEKSLFASAKLYHWLSIGLLTIVLFSCESDYTPKPRGYFQIHFPKKQYQVFSEPPYPYSFEYPVYAKVVKDSSFFGEATENPYWINIDFPQFNGRIYVSYKDPKKYKFDKLVNDSYKLTNKNTVKA